MLDQNTNTAAWLLESFERFNIDPARGLAYLTAHYTGTVAPPLDKAIEQYRLVAGAKTVPTSLVQDAVQRVEKLADTVQHHRSIEKASRLQFSAAAKRC